MEDVEDVGNGGKGGGSMSAMVADRAGRGCIRGNGSGERSLGGAVA